MDATWSFWGTPYKHFYEIRDSRLRLTCIRQALAEEIRPMGFDHKKEKDRYVAFLAKRQREPDVTVSCQMTFTPYDQESAGMAVVQAMNHQLHLERAVEDGKQVVRLVQVTADFTRQPYMPGFASTTNRTALASALWTEADIILQIQMRHEMFIVKYGKSVDCLTELFVADGRNINPEIVGCMTGTMIGVFATGNGQDSENVAQFDWFEMKS